MIDHFITFASEQSKLKAYENYVAECQRINTENIAKIATAITGGKAEANYISVKFSDLLNKKVSTDTSNGRARILNKLKGDEKREDVT